MSNILSLEKRALIISLLAECSSIRAIERVTGVHRDTIMRLGVSVGQACKALLDKRMVNLSCDRVEVDEIWGFIGCKKKNATNADKRAGMGDVWTFLAIDADTKLMPSFTVGLRDVQTTHIFVKDLAGRMAKKIQLTSDAMPAYFWAIAHHFAAVDYAQIAKVYATPTREEQRRYSPPEVVSCEKAVKLGNPDKALISTSYVERVNLTTRLHVKRLSRLTLAFSKKRENFEAAIALHVAYYNFCKIHSTVKGTPAQAAGLERDAWTVADLLNAIA